VVLNQSDAQKFDGQAGNLVAMPSLRSGLYTPFAAASSAKSG
jgi:hypothetical protein